MDIITVADVLLSARGVYLNDPAAVRLPDTKLFPALKVAQGMLETSLEENGVQCKNKEASIKVIAGVKVLNPLPADFIWPVKLDERVAGSSDLYTPMIQRRWTPQEAQGPSLKYWIWNNDQIQLLGATTNRDVLLYYQAIFPTLNAVSDGVYNYAAEYYAAKIAWFVHTFIEQSPTLADSCNDIANGHLDQIIRIMVKKRQSMPVRRRPFRSLK